MLANCLLRNSFVTILLATSSIVPAISVAKNNIETRLDYLEKVLQSQQNLDSLRLTSTLQEEISELRGQLEAQEHQIQVLNTRQEKLFADLDFRVNQLQRYKLPSKSSNKSDESNVNLDIKDKRATNTGNAAAEKVAYNNAYKFVEKKDFKSAETAFQDFLWSYPDGTFTANAYYWLGEIFLSNFSQNKDNELLDKAIGYFAEVTENHATHQKAADSLLKLGIIAEDQEKYQEAVNYFKKLKEKFPSSSRVTVADIHLEKLKREGKS